MFSRRFFKNSAGTGLSDRKTYAYAISNSTISPASTAA